VNLQKAFDQGMVAGVFLMLAASAVYWFISSWSSEISLARTILVILQLILGIGVAAWFLFRRTRYSKTV
jgi:membrane protein YdbS with pleckstrin-like domain